MARSSKRGPAPKRRGRRGSRRRNSRLSLLHGLLWFAGGIGLGLLILLPFYLLSGDDGETPAPPAEEQGPSSPDRPPEPEDTPPPEPRADPAPRERDADREESGYRFYTLLPKMEVEVPEPPAPEASEKKPPTQQRRRPSQPSENAESEPVPDGPPAVSEDGAYLVQVASFRDAEAAESLKARLALKSLKAEVVRADLDAQGTWYRVRLGPYAERSAAETVRRRLAADGMDALVMRP
ncbi:SPOR domain-containing protein [Thiohalorhabdus methylotrophus]|uniref:SPOR domain-containing protein n=1 Tax=Thiohalorhabdus methylotrophus TaxID=3242694 RepID=A0ABV4TYZ0_9GAMM